MPRWRDNSDKIGVPRHRTQSRRSSDVQERAIEKRTRQKSRAMERLVPPGDCDECNGPYNAYPHHPSCSKSRGSS